IKEISQAKGFGGVINRQVAALVQSEYPELFPVAFWQFHGGKTVFLQDGDSLHLPVSQLVEVLGLLKEKLPSIQRITTYARSRTLLRWTVEELVLLRETGLNRIHVGLESGNDQILEFMQKGVTGVQHAEAGQKVKAAGISLSEYVILGLGGTKLWREHALDTAKILNEINPDFIRMRTLAVPPEAPLFKKVQQGEFKLLHDDDVVREEALFVEHLEGIESVFYSDHILNLLEEVYGNLPEDKPAMQKTINSYLLLTASDRERFRLGRRTGYYRNLADRHDQALELAVERIYQQLQIEGITVDDYILQLMRRFI
ncbi:MAG: radical SAM protein, partial [Clostridia bacterium]|nr:radical SAM protein [Clostridia bacterium]